MGFVDYVRRAPTNRAKLLAGETPEWIARHEAKTKSVGRGYIRAIIISAPPWVDVRALLDLQAEAARISKETGVLHVLDHIYPVRHPLVCGLTVPANLQIITNLQNNSKGNRWCPDQMELFE